jgi:glutathione S-transferase
VEIFESGAGLLHLARKSDKLMPRDPVEKRKHCNGRSPRSTRSRWSPYRGGSEDVGDENNDLTGWMGKRLDQLERVLSEQEWLAAGASPSQTC